MHRPRRDANRVTSATHVKREVDVNAILAAKEDGKDLSDKQMAAVLGHKRSHVQVRLFPGCLYCVRAQSIRACTGRRGGRRGR
jgi:hypothetical protein